jgi:hypothetical protein
MANSGILPRNASAPIEHPNVILLLRGSAELFDGSKTAAIVDQFVPKGDSHFTVGTPGLAIVLPTPLLPIEG